MKRFLVIGNPVEHSLSPKLHNYWFNSYNLNGIYGKLEASVKDLPELCKSIKKGELDGLNLVGLKRKGVPRVDIMALRAAFQTLSQGDGTFQDRAQRLTDDSDSEYVEKIVSFVLGRSDRSFLTPR